jgi:hypothetical protein
MLQGLLSAIAETLLMAAWEGIIKFLGWEREAEFLGAAIGLGLIVAGLIMKWQGIL